MFTTESIALMRKDLPLMALPTEIRGMVHAMVGEESSRDMWKGIMDKVIAGINWKDRFSAQVVPMLDKGIREVGRWSQICRACEAQGAEEPQVGQAAGCICVVDELCLNCYWYNSDPMCTSASVCRCSPVMEDISYDQMREHFPDHLGWTSYFEFTKSEEWTNYLENEWNMRMVIDNLEREREAEQEAAREARYEAYLEAERLQTALQEQRDAEDSEDEDTATIPEEYSDAVCQAYLEAERLQTELQERAIAEDLARMQLAREQWGSDEDA